MNIEQLNLDFEKFNLSNEKNSIDRLKFCWKLIESDDSKYLELHLIFLDKASKYFSEDLQNQFQFRKNKEKVFNFLKNKLKENISQKLKSIVTQIIADIDFKTLDEYQTWIEEIKLKETDDEDKFVWAIMKSPFVELHYELMKDEKLNKNFKHSLRVRFDEHGEKAETLLLSKLDNKEDIDFQGEIIFILGTIKGSQKDRILTHARELTKSKNIYTRNKAIIVLGWIGKSQDYEILEKHFLNDTDTECRAWSATAFYIIYNRNKSKVLRIKIFKLFTIALKSEKKYFVLGMIIYSMQQITKNKFGLSQKAIDSLDKDRIDISKAKVSSYIEKEIKKIS